MGRRSPVNARAIFVPIFIAKDINVVDALLERDDAKELLAMVEEQLERQGMERLAADSTHNWLKEGF